jgi:hypothetical protein
VPSRLGCALLKMIWVRRCSPSLQQRTQQAQQAQRDRQHRLAEDDLGQAVQALPAGCGHGRWAVESQLQQRTTKNQNPAQPLAATVPLYFPPTAHTALFFPPATPCPPAHSLELWPHLRGRQLIQARQLVLVVQGAHQREAVAVGEQRLDAVPDLQPGGSSNTITSYESACVDVEVWETET